jgi:hypothetical protein
MEKERLINELVGLSSLQDMLWKYHPSNNNGINIEHEFQQVVDRIKVISEQIKELNKS